MRYLPVLWLAASAAALLLQPAAAQAPLRASAQTATVTGTVRSSVGTPLGDVVVELADAGIGARTDVRGRYRLAGVPAGLVSLRFRLLGWGERSGSVEVAPGAVARLDMELDVDPVQLGALEVLSDRSRLVGGLSRWFAVPGAAHVLDRGRLRAERRLFDDVHAALRQVPGVNVQDEEGFGLRANVGIRGTGVERSSKIAVLEDGVLAAPAPYSAPAAYYFPVLGRMEAVEVRKGSSQVEYGPWTTGGAVNLVSAPVPPEFRLEADVAGGSDATRRVHARVGDTRGGFGYLAETWQVETNGFKRLDGGGDTGFDVRDFLIKLRAATDPAGRLAQELELKLGYTDERSNETYLGLTDAAFTDRPFRRYAASQLDRMEAEHRQIQVRHVMRTGARVDISTTLYRNDFSRNWYKLQSVNGAGLAGTLRDPVRYADELAILEGRASADDALVVRANNRDYYAQGIQSILGARFGDAALPHDVAIGVRWHRDEEDRFQHDDAFRMDAGRMVLTRAGAPGSQDNRVGEAEALAAFASLRLRAGMWTVAPGVRFESIRFIRTDYEPGDAGRAAPTRVRENEVEVWVPGIGVTGDLSRGVAIFGGVHKGFGPPGPGADEAVRAEESINYELGGRLLRGDVMLQTTIFYNDYDNILGRATLAGGTDGSGDLFNGGAVEVRGLELSADYEPVPVRSLRFPVRMAYTYTDARFGTSFESSFAEWGEVEEGDRLPYLPTHQLSAAASAATDRWSLGLSASAASAMRTVAGTGSHPDGTGTDAHFVVNASVEYRATPQATLHGGVQNIFDRRYIVARRPAGARPGLPRTVAIGVRVELN